MAARGELIVLCHQDIRLLTDGRGALDACLTALDARDPTWAVAGNAGGTGIGRLAMRISDPHGDDRRIGSLPERALYAAETPRASGAGWRSGMCQQGTHIEQEVSDLSSGDEFAAQHLSQRFVDDGQGFDNHCLVRVGHRRLLSNRINLRCLSGHALHRNRVPLVGSAWYL